MLPRFCHSELFVKISSLINKDFLSRCLIGWQRFSVIAPDWLVDGQPEAMFENSCQLKWILTWTFLSYSGPRFPPLIKSNLFLLQQNCSSVLKIKKIHFLRCRTENFARQDCLIQSAPAKTRKRKRSIWYWFTFIVNTFWHADAIWDGNIGADQHWFT